MHVPTWDILKKYIEKEHYTQPSFILSIHEYNQEGQGLGVCDAYPYIPLLVVSFTIHYNKLIILLQVFCHTTSRRQRITFNPYFLPSIKPRYLFALGSPFP
jgi:hypothetical protein